MPAFTLEGFESPEEVQTRVGKAKEAALVPKGDINSMIYQTAARGQSALGDAFQSALGQEDPQVAKARNIQEMMKDLDPTTSEGLAEGEKRLREAGEIAAAEVTHKKYVEMRKLEAAEKPKGGKYGIKEIKVGSDIQTWETFNGKPTRILAKADRFSPDDMGLTGAGENALSKAIGKAKGTQIVEGQTSAKKANQGLRTATQAQNLLREGIISGQFANLKIGVASIAKAAGIDVGTDLENTQAFMAKMGNATLDILGSGALGAGTGISDNDRKFAKQIAGGEITLTEEAIKRIIDLNAKVNQNIIKFHNDDFNTVRDKSPVDLSVTASPWKSFAEYDKEEMEAAKKKLNNQKKQGWSIKPIGGQ